MIDCSKIPNKSGVYRLYADSVCVYVGSSIHLKTRLLSHRYREDADRVEWELLPAWRLREEEQRLIDLHSPVLNRLKRAGNRLQCRAAKGSQKFSFTFTDEDYGLIKQVQKELKPQYGKVTLVMIIRIALRKYFEASK